jgi:hypothetical protein
LETKQLSKPSTSPKAMSFRANEWVLLDIKFGRQGLRVDDRERSSEAKE